MKRVLHTLIAGVLCLLLVAETAIPVAQAAGSGDEMVRLTQKWLNQEYGDVPGYGSVMVDGLVGRDTMNGLLRALQHELGIKDLYNEFGPQTTELYSKNPLHRQDGVTSRKFAILQGALWCKGYNPGYNIRESGGKVKFNAVFDADVEKAVIQLKKDMGYEDPSGNVSTRMMKALLSMDDFRLVDGGSSKVRRLQQMLNRKYSKYLEILPCDGVLTGQIEEAAVKALQIEEGLEEATGYFGQQTTQYCPEIPYTQKAQRYSGGPYSDARIRRLTELAQHMLQIRGFDCGTVDGVYGDKTQQALRNFQKSYALSITGKVNAETWKALLTGQRNPSRPNQDVRAADCFTPLDRARARTLYDNGYRYIGRYLTMEPKAITREEAKIIFEEGLRFFPIYQTWANEMDYFTSTRGKEDAQAAMEAGNRLGLPDHTIIYFAVDYDASNGEISNRILPYFKALSQEMEGGHYRIGVYGSRNVCARVSKAGYACSSFVADLSPEYSGNKGYPLPDNWAFDQLSTVTIGSGSGQIEIDRDDFSGRDKGVGTLKLPIPELRLENRISTGRPVLLWDAVDDAMEYNVYYRAGKSGSFRWLATVHGTMLHHGSSKPGTTYYYKVQAVRSDGAGGRFSDVKYRTSDCAQPKVSISLRGDGKPVLTWPAVEGAIGYEVQRSTGDGYRGLTTVKGTRLSNGSAADGQRYSYRVRALCDNSYGNSGWSSPDSIRCGVPEAPVIHLSNRASTGKIRLTWDAVEDAEKYEIYCREGKSGSFHRLYRTTGEHLNHNSAQPGETYYYKVRAVIGDCKSAFSTTKHRTCDLPQPVVSVGLRSDGKPVLTWERVEGAIGYEVQRSVDGGAYDALTTAHGTRLNHTSAHSGHSYRYRVRALCDNSYGSSAWYETDTIRTE